MEDKEYLKTKQLYEFEKELVGKAGYKLVAGIDEAGRGPLAGPVVAAAAIIKRWNNIQGIDDSKKLSSVKRRKLFDYITQDRDIILGVGIISAEIIDSVNILKATHLAMRKAILSLSVRPDCLLIDGLELPLSEEEAIPQKKVIKGDARCLSIACASIIAKVTRDSIMEEYDRQYPSYGFARHKGYGTKDHLNNLKKYGPVSLHRRTFSPIKEMCRQLEFEIFGRKA